MGGVAALKGKLERTGVGRGGGTGARGILLAGEPAAPVDPTALDAIVAANARLLSLFAANAPRPVVIRAAEETIALLKAHAPAQAAQLPPGGAEAVLAALDSPWFRSFVALDPAPAWQATEVPVLFVIGALDTQVDAPRNLGAIRALIPEERLTAVELPRLNHLFQPAETGHPSEYPSIETTLDDSLFEVLLPWIARVTGVAAGVESP